MLRSPGCKCIESVQESIQKLDVQKLFLRPQVFLAVLPFFDLVGPIVRLLLASGSVLVLVLVDAIWGGMGLVTLGVTDPSSSFSDLRGDKSESAASAVALNMDDADVDMVDPETDVEDRDVEPASGDGLASSRPSAVRCSNVDRWFVFPAC